LVRYAQKAWGFLVILMLSAPGAFPAQGDGDIRLSDLSRDALAATPLNAPRRGDGAGRALDALLAGRALPTSCASPLLMDLYRRREPLPATAHESLRLLMARPNLLHEEVYQTRDGRFLIHYTLDPGSPDAIEAADSDLNGVPDQVDRVEAALERAVEVLSAGLSWPLPAPGTRSDSYDLYLASLGSVRGGLTVPDREITATPQDDASSHILVDSRIDPDRVGSVVIHQFAHASLLALSARAPAWWNEGTAGWMEAVVTGDPSLQRDALSRRLDRLDRSLMSDSLLLSLGDSLWVAYLADRREEGAEDVRQIWIEQSLRSSESFPLLLDEILRRNGGDGLSGGLRDFSRWALFTGSRDDGEHFRKGTLLPPLTPRGAYQTFPADSGGAESVEPLGAAVYRLAGDGSHGGIRIKFDAAEAPSMLQVDLVITPVTGSRRPYLVELRPGATGAFEVGVPWRDVAETMMIVRNPASGGAAARFHFSAFPDPLFPYDLSSFAAASAGGGITLQWSTDHEEDLLGWNVYRSAGPGGPFLRINPVTLPSGGDSEEETNYIYQDTSAAAGRRYYYRLEGITLQGLPERSFPISAMASEPAPLP
jgi:hypothetical protein